MTEPLIAKPGPRVSVLPTEPAENWIAVPPLPVIVPALKTVDAPLPLRKKIPDTPEIVPPLLLVIVAVSTRMPERVVAEMLPELVTTVPAEPVVLMASKVPEIVPALFTFVVPPLLRMATPSAPPWPVA